MDQLNTLEQARSYLANILGTSHDYVIAVDKLIALQQPESVSNNTSTDDTDWIAALCLGESFASAHFGDNNGKIPKYKIQIATIRTRDFYIDLLNKSNYFLRDALENANIYYESIEGVRTYIWEQTSILINLIINSLEE